jgi:hypothetical protein
MGLLLDFQQAFLKSNNSIQATRPVLEILQVQLDKRDIKKKKKKKIPREHGALPLLHDLSDPLYHSHFLTILLTSLGPPRTETAAEGQNLAEKSTVSFLGLATQRKW